ncbi:MAG TPA: hypothetical protein VGE38_07000 [Nocardioides sp.]|uniref:hypothetical protein n=1 Tax=Nocardioides sp. TaxID=35761 RepID=UPI002ED9ADCB
MTGGLRPSDVITYTSDRAARGERDAYWCLEGLAVVDDEGRAFDTFWGSGTERHLLTETERATAKFVFNLAEFDELDRWRPDIEKWMSYAPDDRGRVTSQHRLEQRLYVRKGAKPAREVMIENARAKVAEAEADAAHAQRMLLLAQEDLAALVAAPDDCVCRPAWCVKADCPSCAPANDWRKCSALPARLGGAA